MCHALIALVPLFLSSPARAEDVSFAGQTIRFVVPFSANGGSDTWARFNAQFLSRHLPGQPEVVVENQPGGGGTRGANSFASLAQPDGLTVLGTSGTTQFPYLLGDLRVRYDYRDWQPVMVAPSGGVVYVSADLGLDGPNDIAELLDKNLVFASQGPTSLDLVTMLAFRVLGLKVNYVFGYAGRADGQAAMMRGDANIDYQTTPAYLRNVAPLVADGELVPLMSWGVLGQDGERQRDPTFPNLPTVEEVHFELYGVPPSGADYDAYRAFSLAGFSAQKIVVLPGSTPVPIIDAWIRAWQDVFADPEYQEKAPAVLGSYPQVTGAQADFLYQAATTIAPGARTTVLEMLSAEYDVYLQGR